MYTFYGDATFGWESGQGQGHVSRSEVKLREKLTMPIIMRVLQVQTWYLA